MLFFLIGVVGVFFVLWWARLFPWVWFSSVVGVFFLLWCGGCGLSLWCGGCRGGCCGVVGAGFCVWFCLVVDMVFLCVMVGVVFLWCGGCGFSQTIATLPGAFGTF